MSWDKKKEEKNIHTYCVKKKEAKTFTFRTRKQEQNIYTVSKKKKTQKKEDLYWHRRDTDTENNTPIMQE